MIKLYLANLGKYNEGILKGNWIELPLSGTELEEAMVEIGVAHYDKDGNYVPYVIETDEKGNEYIYEEYAIHDYETDLSIAISEYSSVDDLNSIAENVGDVDIKYINTLLDAGEIDMQDLIEKPFSDILEGYAFVELDNSLCGSDEEKVGYSFIDGVFGGPESLTREVLERYFDYEAYGRDLLLSGEGFVSDGVLVLK